MRITVNGELMEVAEGWTILRLLEEKQVNPQTAVLEHNGQILPRSEWGDCSLKVGDELEIFRFLGGG